MSDDLYEEGQQSVYGRYFEAFKALRMKMCNFYTEMRGYTVLNKKCVAENRWGARGFRFITQLHTFILLNYLFIYLYYI